MMDDPPRLDQDPTALAHLLRAAQEDVLAPETVLRLKERLVASGVLPIVTVETGAHAGRLARWARVAGAKWALGGVVVSLVWGAWRFGSTSQRATAATKPPVAASSSASSSPRSGEEVRLPPADASATPNLASVAPTAASHTRPTPRNGAPGSTTPNALPLPTVREGALLLEARRALETDPVRALALVRKHQREFPRSQLEPERSRIAAEAARRGAE